jgi:hypothetical protein
VSQCPTFGESGGAKQWKQTSVTVLNFGDHDVIHQVFSLDDTWSNLNLPND